MSKIIRQTIDAISSVTDTVDMEFLPHCFLPFFKRTSNKNPQCLFFIHTFQESVSKYFFETFIRLSVTFYAILINAFILELINEKDMPYLA